MLSITLCLLVGLGLVGLQFAKLLGSKHEHVNATEAAALAGAQALSRIVIEEIEMSALFRLLIIHLQAKIQSPVMATRCQLLVGINTLAATVRLDNIIADQARRCYAQASRSK